MRFERGQSFEMGNVEETDDTESQSEDGIIEGDAYERIFDNNDKEEQDRLVNEISLEHLRSNSGSDAFFEQYRETLSEDSHLVGIDGTVTERYPSDVIEDNNLAPVYESFAETSENRLGSRTVQEMEIDDSRHVSGVESETSVEWLIDQERMRLDGNLQSAALEMKSAREVIKDSDGLLFNRPERFMIGIMKKLDEMRTFYNEPKTQETSAWDSKQPSPVDREYWDNFYRSLGRQGTKIGVGVGALSLLVGAPITAAFLGGATVRLGRRYFMHEGKKMTRDMGALEQNTKLLDRVSNIEERSASEEDIQRFQESLTPEEVEYLKNSTSISAQSRKLCGIE